MVLLKDGEKESVRIWLEVCNENAGRSILPFNGMLPGDAYLWTKYRDDEALDEKIQRVYPEKDLITDEVIMERLAIGQ